MPKKTCRGLFYKDSKLTQKMTPEEIQNDIICVPNKVNTEQYYKLDYKTNKKFNFVGYKNLMKRCFQSEEIELPNCRYTSAYSVNPDFHLIRIYLESLSNTNFASELIKESTLSELEELKKSEPSKELWEDIKYIEQIKTKFEENKTQIEIAPHIYEFINNLVEYTDITLEKLNEMFNGGYTLITGDKGVIYQKFLNKSEEQIKNSEKEGITHFTLSNPLIYTYAKFFNEKDQNKISTEIPNRKYEKSSHPSYDYTQLRMGAGSIINCNEISDECVRHRFELLIGTSMKDGYVGDTWFQFENSRMDTKINWASHALDAIRYGARCAGSFCTFGLIEKKNLGPFGWSDYNDTNPQYLSVCNKVTNRKSGKLEHCIHKTEKTNITEILKEEEDDGFRGIF